jgi:hypothetical protein
VNGINENVLALGPFGQLLSKKDVRKFGLPISVWGETAEGWKDGEKGIGMTVVEGRKGEKGDYESGEGKMGGESNNTQKRDKIGGGGGKGK